MVYISKTAGSILKLIANTLKVMYIQDDQDGLKLVPYFNIKLMCIDKEDS